MTDLSVVAPAKVNLHLEVLKRRHDGYHEIETILQAIDLQDCLEVTLDERLPAGPPAIDLLVRPVGAAPEDATNLCWRAAEAFCQDPGVSGRLPSVLEKAIPSGAGLGGGSSDAMAVIMACDRLFGTALELADLERIGALLGSDVPFFAVGGTQLGRGRGTKLTRLATPKQAGFVVLKPGFGVTPGIAYAALTTPFTPRAPPPTQPVRHPF
mgnify:CR=1 FL=1